MHVSSPDAARISQQPKGDGKGPAGHKAWTRLTIARCVGSSRWVTRFRPVDQAISQTLRRTRPSSSSSGGESSKFLATAATSDCSCAGASRLSCSMTWMVPSLTSTSAIDSSGIWYPERKARPASAAFSIRKPPPTTFAFAILHSRTSASAVRPPARKSSMMSTRSDGLRYSVETYRSCGVEATVDLYDVWYESEIEIWRCLRAKTHGNESAFATNMAGSRPVASTVRTLVGCCFSSRSASSSPHASIISTSTMWLTKLDTLRMSASRTVASRSSRSLSSVCPAVFLRRVPCRSCTCIS
mmetsp:Transcript_27925/g.89546  ORF Transcript_27925/g.89546 Transcript_27925/m.89546 type:complete len:299 (-) Transcript_27925:709-1605(-)